MSSRGFTLVELVLVIVIAGVLAVVAAPRFSGGGFGSRAAAGELIEAIRYAQAMTLSQGGVSVFSVRIDSSGYEVLRDGNPTRGPMGNSAGFTDDDWSGVAVSPTGTVSFDARGRPSCAGGLSCTDAAQIIRVSQGGATTELVLEPVTGYVR